MSSPLKANRSIRVCSALALNQFALIVQCQMSAGAQRDTEAIAGVAAFTFARESAFGN